MSATVTAAAPAAVRAAPHDDDAVLDVRGLGVSFRRRGSHQPTRVLDGVDLVVRPGEIVGVVGETGSGKTTLARAVVGLAPVDRGSVHLDGRELTGLRRRAQREWRRSGVVQFVFQDPLRSLDPDLTVDRIVGEGLAITGVPRAERARRVRTALERVGLDPELGVRTPAALSGGQRQRVSIARAVVSEPRLLICDEPVSALDASNRNHVLRLLAELRDELGLGIVLITHDLSSLAGIADRVVVLYRGRAVETGPVGPVFEQPRHPYTALLVASAPSVTEVDRVAPAQLRRGADQAPWTAGGCVFAGRCPFATAECAHVPEPRDVGGGRLVACHHDTEWPGHVAPAPQPDGASPRTEPAAGQQHGRPAHDRVPQEDLA